MFLKYSFYSRSQCIITIRRAKDVFDTSNDMPFGNGVLVIADLAGAERDKKTGNMVNLPLKLVLYIHILFIFSFLSSFGSDNFLKLIYASN